MRRRNVILIVLVVILAVANVFISRMSTFTSRVSFDVERFMVQDTASIKEVQLTSTAGDVILTRNGGGWQVNHLHQTDESLRQLLFSILQRVRVKRKATTEPDRAVTVIVKTEAGEQSFEVFGNLTRTKTFFSQSGETFEVEIPGYRDFLGSIFELSANQWRDRLVFDGNWRSIQNLTLSYPHEEVNIAFKESFFDVKGVQSLDSNRVVSYLNQFEYFQVNEWIDLKKFPKYESLSLESPVATLSISSIHYATPFQLDFYPVANGDRVQLVKTSSGEWAVIDLRRVRSILLENSAFAQKE